MFGGIRRPRTMGRSQSRSAGRLESNSAAADVVALGADGAGRIRDRSWQT